MTDVFDALAAPARRAILDVLVARDDQTLFELCGRLAADHDIALHATGDLTAPRGARGRRSRAGASRRPLQVPLHRHGPAVGGGVPMAAARGALPMTIRIHLTSVFVDDQERALRFYTDVLGFEPRSDVPLGNGDRWLTVAPPDQEGVELLLEPASHPAVGPYRTAIIADGIPLASFAVDDIGRRARTPRPRGRHVHPAAHRDGTGHHRGLRRYVRQPHPARRDVIAGATGPTGPGGRPRARRQRGARDDGRLGRLRPHVPRRRTRIGA